MYLAAPGRLFCREEGIRMSDRERFEHWAERAAKGDALHEPPKDLVERTLTTLRAEEAPASTPPVRTYSPLLRWGLAAAAALVVVFALWPLLRSPGPTLPDPAGGSTTRSAAVRELAPEGELASMPEAFDWAAVPDAHTYRIRILGVDDAVLIERVIDTPRWVPDDAALAALDTAVRYGWTVEALDAEGRATAASARGWFRVRP